MFVGRKPNDFDNPHYVKDSSEHEVKRTCQSQSSYKHDFSMMAWPIGARPTQKKNRGQEKFKGIQYHCVLELTNKG